MGNFRHQSTRTSDRDRDKDTDKEKDRDRDTKDGLRSVSPPLSERLKAYLIFSSRTSMIATALGSLLVQVPSVPVKENATRLLI